MRVVAQAVGENGGCVFDRSVEGVDEWARTKGSVYAGDGGLPVGLSLVVGMGLRRLDRASGAGWRWIVSGCAVRYR